MGRYGASRTRTKHPDIKYHVVRYLLKEGEVKIEYCPNMDIIADVFRNPFSKIIF